MTVSGYEYRTRTLRYTTSAHPIGYRIQQIDEQKDGRTKGRKEDRRKDGRTEGQKDGLWRRLFSRSLFTRDDVRPISAKIRSFDTELRPKNNKATSYCPSVRVSFRLSVCPSVCSCVCRPQSTESRLEFVDAILNTAHMAVNLGGGCAGDLRGQR